ncbi:MAG TPA: saccharopine dehydrogenase NADP-binding domain-containing protein [Thermoanaerobaculia bacterium]|nr:saccharopine dehydrogenase NADP-binding domain-containing protein [Thermoanaerobaculia bacterium]
MSELLIYGANGYTGELCAREAATRGLAPILAGRNRAAVEGLAGELGLAARVFDLDQPEATARSLTGVAAVLHCAGPFVRTSGPMVAACLAAGAHYLDITGEIEVFEKVFARHAQAERAGVALLPGVGFDVVPSDCLAGRLAGALPEATSLVLAFGTAGGSWSRGTLKTMIESLPHAGAIRRDGRLVPVPLAWEAREIEFSGRFGKRWCASIPWGDLSTAFRSTGIPDIQVFTAMSRREVRRARWLRPFLPILGWGPIKRRLQRRVERRLTGPSAEVRATARTYLWGEAANAAGRKVRATLETPEAYGFTATSAIACTERVLGGEVKPGAWTPAQAFGARFVDGLPGVVAGPIVEV